MGFVQTTHNSDECQEVMSVIIQDVKDLQIQRLFIVNGQSMGMPKAHCMKRVHVIIRRYDLRVLSCQFSTHTF